MAVTTELNDGVCLFKVDGDMTIYTAASIKDELVTSIRACHEMQVDLSQVCEMDTAGVQLMLLFKFEAARLGKKLHFVGHSQSVLEVIAIFNLAALMGVREASATAFERI